MAPEIGLSASAVASASAPQSVRARLLADPTRFDFFQAVRLLERLYPGRRPVGRHADPRDEVVRFRARPSVAFPAAEIHDLYVSEETPTSEVLAMVVNFMGLFGPQGVLPHHYSLLVAEPPAGGGAAAVSDIADAPRRRRNTAPALRAFLDIFNHRFISLFFRAWEKYRFTIAFERGEYDRFSTYVRSFIGIGTAGLQGRLGIEDHTLLYYGGLLAKRPRSAMALEGVLQDHFDVPVDVVQFEGSWFRLEKEQVTRLAAGGQNQLGVDAGLWARFWDPQVRFRIRLGPLTLRQFRAFLPSGDAYTPLVQSTRFVVGEEFSFDVQLILRRDEVPMCALGGPSAGRLGWSTWLKTQPFPQDAAHAVFVARSAEMAERDQEP